MSVFFICRVSIRSSAENLERLSQPSNEKRNSCLEKSTVETGSKEKVRIYFFNFFQSISATLKFKLIRVYTY